MKFFLHKLNTLKGVSFLNENRKLVLEFIVTLFFIGIAFWLLNNEKTELTQVRSAVLQANASWFLAGLLVVVLYILLQGLMYYMSFAAINVKTSFSGTLLLFLKRNFISVFLPVGGVSSLAFYTGSLEKRGISKTQIYFASSIYGFVGILTVIIVAIPAFLYALAAKNIEKSEWLALTTIVLMLAGIFFLFKSLMAKGALFNRVSERFPRIGIFLTEIESQSVNRRKFFLTIIISLLIEFTGIAHVFIAMKAIGTEPSFYISVIAYIVVVIFLLVSPFLRGLGAIEVSMAYLLTMYGIPKVEAISVMFLFRFFEFWLPLIAGVFSFLLRIDKLLMRIVPPFLLLCLGAVNIVSVVTPSIAARLVTLKEFLIPQIIDSSNLLVLFTGFLLLATSVFMLKGLRSTWWLAIILTLISVFGHLTKGIDYEEASVAFAVLLILVATRREYNIKSNPRLQILGVQAALFTICLVLIYGVVGFYFLDKRHFHIDFSLTQSVEYTIKSFFLLNPSELLPDSRFAHHFILTIKLSGFMSMMFLFYTLLKPYVIKTETGEIEIKEAERLVETYGKSALDYFKYSPDKLFYFTENKSAFLAYRISGNYAVVLENPVGPDTESIKNCIVEFNRFGFQNGFKIIYYRIPALSLPLYAEMRMKSMFIGQEGVVDLDSFTLSGRAAKSIRNAISKVRELGYTSHVYQPPQLDGNIQKLKMVSSDWLHSMEREEICFSQGMFVESEIKNQVIITVENSEGKIVAFMNVIPDYAENEGTYDLLRKTSDAPNGVADFIMVELFGYFKSAGVRFVNLGFTPLSHIENPKNFPERSMKFAYEKIRSFAHFKGQREYKEKFVTQWNDCYVVFPQDYDLLQLPAVLSKVIKP